MTNHLLNLLQQACVISDEQLQNIESELTNEPSKIISLLIEKKVLTSRALADFMSQHFNEPICTIELFDFNKAVTIFDRPYFILKHQVLPLKITNNLLTLAVSDLTNTEPLDEIRFLYGFQIKSVLVEHQFLIRAINKLYGNTEPATTHQSTKVSDDELSQLAKLDGEDAETQILSDGAVSRMINEIILEAAKKKVSDIHFEPFEDEYTIRVRLDGILHLLKSPPAALSRRISACLKIMSQLDITERRLPQDGRISFAISEDKSIDIRVSTLPTLWGEKIVLRLLDNANVALDIDALGYSEAQKKDLLLALHKPQGMILMTGPTGSGKTVSLYTALTYLNTPSRSIFTAEDPVEISLHGISQSNINTEIDFDFATTLRAFLRQDPDVIMVGEIRDLQTAEIGIKAAQTGHLVLSSLHTNSAAETIIRLSHMGIAPYHLAASLTLIIAQRLARRLCPHCKEPHDLKDPALQALKNRYPNHLQGAIYQAHKEGCMECHYGYLGRVGIYEVMKINKKLTESITHSASAQHLEQVAIENGMTTLALSGIEKVKAGITSLEELLRVIDL